MVTGRSIEMPVVPEPVYQRNKDLLRENAALREALTKAKDHLDKHIYGDPRFPWPSDPDYQDDLDRAYGVIIAALNPSHSTGPSK